MSQEQQRRLFQDYAQADASTSGSYGGTGLGLSICRRLCKLMCGDISVHSIMGQGSTFRVRLPLPVADAGPAIDEDAELTLDLGGCRVLVVDDNPHNLAVAQAILGAVDGVVETAQSAVQALDILRWGSFDLVLTDLHMPDMDGQELARRIRRGEAGPSTIAIVALTGDVKFASDDFDAVHPKPIQAASLLESLARLRSGRTPAPDSVAGSDRLRA
jgi:CheY-like chemotaxis protein